MKIFMKARKAMRMNHSNHDRMWRWPHKTPQKRKSRKTTKKPDAAHARTAGFKEPFHEVKCVRNERILGRQVDANPHAQTPVKQRVKFGNAIFTQLKHPIFLNKKYTIKTKLLLWNAIIRSLMTYGLNVHKLSEAEKKCLMTLH